MPSIKWRSFCLGSQKQLSNMTSSYWIPELFMGDNWKRKEKKKKNKNKETPKQKTTTTKTNKHFNVVIMSAMASQITGLTIIYSTVYSGVDQRKHQSSASLAFVRGIHRWPVNSPHKGPVTGKMFPFDDVIMEPGIPGRDGSLQRRVFSWK